MLVLELSSVDQVLLLLKLVIIIQVEVLLLCRQPSHLLLLNNHFFKISPFSFFFSILPLFISFLLLHLSRRSLSRIFIHTHFHIIDILLHSRLILVDVIKTLYIIFKYDNCIKYILNYLILF